MSQNDLLRNCWIPRDPRTGKPIVDESDTVVHDDNFVDDHGALDPETVTDLLNDSLGG